MSLCAGTPAARACSAWARPISPRSIVAALFNTMFWGLKRRDAHATAAQHPAQTRHERAFTCMRCGALHHQVSSAQAADACHRTHSDREFDGPDPA